MASDQETVCAVCLERKHTPLRRDEMGGYVCLTCIERQLDALQAASAIPPSGEAIGEAGRMPGTDGFTMAAFKASDVPVGTKLYAAPPAPVAIDEAVVERAAEALFLASKQQFYRLFPSATVMEWDWVTLSEELREDARVKARATLLAALNPQPNGGA